MRSSIVALALVASAVPALSAPFPENVDSFDMYVLLIVYPSPLLMN